MNSNDRQAQQQGGSANVWHSGINIRSWSGWLSQCEARPLVSNAALYNRERVEAINETKVAGEGFPKESNATNKFRFLGFNDHAVNADRIHNQGLRGFTVSNIQEQAQLPIILREVHQLNRDRLSGNGSDCQKEGNESFHAFRQTASSVPAIVLWAIPPNASTQTVRQSDTLTQGVTIQGVRIQ
jgi:hypothetical protein